MALAIPNELEKLRDGAKRFLDDFTAGQKTVVAIAFLSVVVGIVAFLHYSSKPTYAPLYTNLTSADAASITAKLQSENVPFQLADNGTTVEVPQSDVNAQRIALAEAGLPSQQHNVGLSKVDSEGITTSSFQQQVDYQQGLQGELQSTIEAINGVQSAQVNIVLPNTTEQVISNSNTTPTAAVMLTLQPGITLSTQEVQAIVHLVASSVPNLSSNNVTVTDSQGNLLAGPGATQGSLTSQDQQTTLYQNAVAQQIEAEIEPLVGPNNAVVQVHAVLNFNVDNKTINGLQTNPDGTPQEAVTQSNQQNQSATGTTVVPGGTAGAITNNGTGLGNAQFNSQGVQQNFKVGTYTEEIQQAPGGITTQNVSVVVNSRALPKGISVNQIYQLVATTAGINNARGDVATVEALPFSNAVANAQSLAQKAAQAQARHNDIVNAVKIAGVVLAILIILWLIHRSARKPEEILPEELPALEAGEDEFFAAEEELPISEEEEGALAPGEVNPFDVDLAEGIPHELETSSIGEFIENQPDEVARLLRAWMQETKTPGTPSQRQTESV
jgi:flagellar M-ring protein FliF